MPSRGIAETTLERSDDDPKGVFFIVNEQKTHKKEGGVAFLGSPRAKKYAGISVRKYQYRMIEA